MTVFSNKSYTTWFLYTLIITLIIKIGFAYAIPFTADEAYYVMWGKHLAWGYYDHPPLIGWILHGFLYISDHQVWMRTPTIIMTSLIGWLIFALLKPYDADKAALIGILFLISPLNLLGMLITTDIPLILFVFLSGAAAFTAIKQNDHLGYYSLAGMCFGLALLSKYFAVFLGLAYFIYAVLYVRHSKRFYGFVLIFSVAAPFILMNLIWNYYWSWSNILFNIFNRNTSSQLHYSTIMSYLLIVFYILTPVISYYLIKNWRQWFKSAAYAEFSLLKILWLVPLGLFFILSSVKSIGLHWPLAFVPFVYLFMLVFCHTTEIIRSNKFMLWFTGLHIALAITVLSLPFASWQQLGFQDRKYAELVYISNHHEINDYLTQYSDNYMIGSPTYAKAVMFYFDTDHYATTFGKGSVHGRQDDFLADFKQWDGKDFVLFDSKTDLAKKFSAYFRHIEEKSFQFHGADYYLLFGYDFDYEQYHKDFITLIKNRYWTIPEWLPYGRNFFDEKYR